MKKELTMRQAVAEIIKSIDHEDMYFLTADVGYGVLDGLKDRMKDRFINVGLAEQSMIGVASGLALSGKEVFTYSMCSFYLRALEQIKLDLCYQDVPVKIIGVGTGFDYEYLGTTHFGIDDEKIISHLLNIDVVTPQNQSELESALKRKINRPLYIRVGGYIENLDFPIDWKKLKKYPKEGGDRQYFKEKYSK